MMDSKRYLFILSQYICIGPQMYEAFCQILWGLQRGMFTNFKRKYMSTGDICMQGKICHVIRCPFSCFLTCHSLSSSHHQGSWIPLLSSKLLSTHKDFETGISFLQNTHFTHLIPPLPATYPAPPKSTYKYFYACLRYTLDIFQGLHKVPPLKYYLLS